MNNVDVLLGNTSECLEDTLAYRLIRQKTEVVSQWLVAAPQPGQLWRVDPDNRRIRE